MNILTRTLGALTGSNSSLTRFNPEPRSRSTFSDALSTIGSAATGLPGGLSDVDPLFGSLIKEQLEAQRQMQIVSFISNNEKSKHETQMAAIRNIRVG